MTKRPTEEPTVAPIVSGEVVAPFRCWRCDQFLAEAAGPGTVKRCLRCGAKSHVPALPNGH